MYHLTHLKYLVYDMRNPGQNTRPIMVTKWLLNFMVCHLVVQQKKSKSKLVDFPKHSFFFHFFTRIWAVCRAENYILKVWKLWQELTVQSLIVWKNGFSTSRSWIKNGLSGCSNLKQKGFSLRSPHI